MKKSILVLCTGNSCRSQMAEGLLKSFGDSIEVYSAGTEPADEVHPKAVKVMKEIGVDISKNHPKLVNEFLGKQIDCLITVCDSAEESCPVFTGRILNRRYIRFEDPAKAVGTEEEILNEFRQIRDQIKTKFYDFYETNIRTKSNDAN